MSDKKLDKHLEKVLEKVVMRIADNIRRLRHSHKLTQEDMISYGYSLRAYQRLELAETNPTIKSLVRLAEIFNCDVKEFFK